MIGITRKAWNTTVSELTKSICMGITLHSSWDLDGSSVGQKVDVIPIGCHNVTRRTGGLVVDVSHSKHDKHR